jgi:septal ring factor EnvC (AmiA/AmiB activator)
LFATILARIQNWTELATRWVSSPLKSLGFSVLQTRLLCCGLLLIFFSQIAAPSIDQMADLQKQQRQIRNDVHQQKLINHQMEKWNRLLEEDLYFQAVQYRKLTGFRKPGEYTLEEFLRIRTPQS